jgi:hypothetical protein
MKLNRTAGGQSPSAFRRLTGWLFAIVAFAAMAASATYRPQL